MNQFAPPHAFNWKIISLISNLVAIFELIFTIELFLKFQGIKLVLTQSCLVYNLLVFLSLKWIPKHLQKHKASVASGDRKHFWLFKLSGFIYPSQPAYLIEPTFIVIIVNILSFHLVSFSSVSVLAVKIFTNVYYQIIQALHSDLQHFQWMDKYFSLGYAWFQVLDKPSLPMQPWSLQLSLQQVTEIRFYLSKLWYHHAT